MYEKLKNAWKLAWLDSGWRWESSQCKEAHERKKGDEAMKLTPFVNQIKPETSTSWDYLLRFLLLHFVLTTAIGLLMPKGIELAAAHQFTLPLIDLIPNVKRYAVKSVDPIFAETFIACSLVTGSFLLLLLFFSMPVSITKIFNNSIERYFALSICTILVIGLICIFWLVSSNPISQGRAYFAIKAATSSYFGIVFVMNFLLVGIPFSCFGFILAAWRSSTTMQLGLSKFMKVPK